MFKSKNIHGLAFILPLLAVMLMLAIFGKPRSRFSTAEDAPQTAARQNAAAEPHEPSEPFEFDPNTAEYEELLALGLSKYSANALLHWRTGGKVFSIKEDLHMVRGVSDSLYQRLKPYIVIGSEFAQKPQKREAGEYAPRQRYERPQPRYQPFRIDTATVAFLAGIGFSERQAEVLVDYRDMRGGLYSMEEFARCYVVDSAMCDALADYIIFPPREEKQPGPRVRTEINSADSAALRSIRGIGEKSVADILDYRERLGGFYDLNQLAEVKSVTESNFEKILTQIYCDTCNISKIDINFATPDRLDRHPYIGRKKLRRLFHKRELKGGWSKIEEMIDDDIFTEQEAAKLRPYLRFTHKAD